MLGYQLRVSQDLISGDLVGLDTISSLCNLHQLAPNYYG